jgi:ribosome-binding ATPase YchF (GTP1/OBG family)
MKRRKSKNPVATRYRIAITALRKAERRKAAAEQSIRELAKKVRYYERTIPADERAELRAADADRKEAERMRKERWKEAERTLLAAARVQGMSRSGVQTLFTAGKVKRRIGMAVELREGGCLVWDFRDGFKTGLWVDRNNRKKLTKPTDPPAGVDPIAWRTAA